MKNVRPIRIRPNRRKEGLWNSAFTFFQKNKSAKVKQEVARIQAQEAVTGKSRATVEKEKEQQMRAKEKLEAEKRKKEEAALLRPVQSQKVPFGVDPKTVLCAFFKAGHCDKGNKCKFSHDLNVDRKVEKKNLYEDSREDKMNGAFSFCSCVLGVCSAETQIRWIHGTRRSWRRLSSRRQETRGQRQMCVPPSTYPVSRFYLNRSQIVCKHFIQAIETQKCVRAPPHIHLLLL